MLRRTLTIALLLGTLARSAVGQSYCPQPPAAPSTKLACEIPFTSRAEGTTATSFNSTLAIQLSQLPLATAGSGFALTFDKNGNLTVASQDLGPVYSQRPETVGKNKLFLSFTYQRFAFSSIDGTNLDNVPLVFTVPATANSSPTEGVTTNRIDLKINQYVGQATYGVTDWLDISVAIPFERVSMGVTTQGSEYLITSSGAVGPVPIATDSNGKSVPRFTAGSASGISDMVVNAKFVPWKWEHFAMAAGLEFRVPTGDPLNYLGSGTVAWKPYIALSRPGRITPHVNAAYQWSGKSIISPVLDANQVNQPNAPKNVLPDVLYYAAGAETSIVSRFTVAADFIGQRYVDAPRLLPGSDSTLDSLGIANRTLQSVTESYSVDNFSIGAKVRLKGSLILTGNALIKLDNGGLRAKVVPLGGLSYTF